MHVDGGSSENGLNFDFISSFSCLYPVFNYFFFCFCYLHGIIQAEPRHIPLRGFFSIINLSPAGGGARGTRSSSSPRESIDHMSRELPTVLACILLFSARWFPAPRIVEKVARSNTHTHTPYVVYVRAPPCFNLLRLLALSAARGMDSLYRGHQDGAEFESNGLVLTSTRDMGPKLTSI